MSCPDYFAAMTPPGEFNANMVMDPTTGIVYDPSSVPGGPEGVYASSQSPDTVVALALYKAQVASSVLNNNGYHTYVDQNGTMWFWEEEVVKATDSGVFSFEAGHWVKYDDLQEDTQKIIMLGLAGDLAYAPANAAFIATGIVTGLPYAASVVMYGWDVGGGATVMYYGPGFIGGFNSYHTETPLPPLPGAMAGYVTAYFFDDPLPWLLSKF